MLAFKIDGNFVELDDAFSITINSRSPIFSDRGSFSFPFRFRNTPRNRAFFKWIHRPQVQHQSTDHFGELFFGGIRLPFSGTVKIKSAGEYYEGTLYCERGDFNYLSKKLFVHKIDHGELEFVSNTPAMAYLNETFQGLYPTYPYCLPMIFNDKYTDNPSGYAYWNFYNLIDQSNNYELQQYFGYSGMHTILVPMMYLQGVLKNIFREMDLTYSDLFFARDEELSQLVLYSSYNLNKSMPDPNNTLLMHQRFNFFLPQVTVASLLKGLQDWFNMRFFTKELSQSVEAKSLDSILKSSSSVDFNKNILSKGPLEFPDRIENFSLSVTGDPGDEYYADFLSLETAILDKVKGTVLTNSDLPQYPFVQPGDLYYVEDENTYYKVDASHPWHWNEDAGFLENIKSRFSSSDFKKSDLDINTSFSCLLHDIKTDQYPHCGNKQEEAPKISPRLMFAQRYEPVQGIPRIRARIQLDNHSLLWSGVNGIYNTFYKDWLDWYQNRMKLLHLTKLLSISSILNLDYSLPYSIDGGDYLLSEYKITLRKNIIEPAEMEFYYIR